jgi:hypothetical protein
VGRLRIKPDPLRRKMLKRDGKVKVKLDMTYWVTRGTPSTQYRIVTLKRD